MTLQQLQAPVFAEYNEYIDCYSRLAASDVPLLDEVEQYLARHAGKQLRPLLVLLSAKAAFGRVERKHILAAAAVEMLHNATLMHDDVVDESDSRRGSSSIRGRWGNQVAVLCGDYYLTQVLSLMHDIDEPQLADVVNNTVVSMCQGELRQLSLVRAQKHSELDYLEVIGAKTANLMSLCCYCGAYNFELHQFDPSAESLRRYGYNYGMLFQIHDDINDCNAAHDIQLPQGGSACQLLDRYAAEARSCLQPLPGSPARQTLLDMLSPHAPQPRG